MPTNRYFDKGKALAVLSLFCCVQLWNPVSLAAQEKKTTITYKGNVFEMLNLADTVTMLDPVTTEISTVINNPNPIPLKLNNMNIYAEGDVDKEPSVTCDMLRRYIVQSLNRQIAVLGNGEYRLHMSNVIVSEAGKIVYYNFDGLEKSYAKKVITSGSDNIYATQNGATNMQGAVLNWKSIDAATNSMLSAQVDKLMNKAPAYQPASVQNTPVPYRLPDAGFEKTFTVKNGAIYYN
ncbi:MAG: hypothetical protein H6550_04500 [Chitinophagales bacterium]|nr:hypothetical protein [Chitinophagales bacterium]